MRTQCGLDEAGRGALAGPLVAAAVILPCSIQTVERKVNMKVKDGKLLTDKSRRLIYRALAKLGGTIVVEVISTRQINNHGIGWANKEIFRRLIKKVEADEYIIDGKLKIGTIRGKTEKIRSVVDADATIGPVILAGIIAKVERDKLMRTMHKEFPKYAWKSNAGYGTKIHIQAIYRYSTTRYHRNIFISTALRKFVSSLA